MSLKTFLSRIPAMPAIGVGLILLSILSFRANGKILPMIGSAIGTWLLIESWDKAKGDPAVQRRAHALTFLLRKLTSARDQSVN